MLEYVNIHYCILGDSSVHTVLDCRLGNFQACLLTSVLTDKRLIILIRFVIVAGEFVYLCIVAIPSPASEPMRSHQDAVGLQSHLPSVVQSGRIPSIDNMTRMGLNKSLSKQAYNVVVKYVQNHTAGR